MIGDRENPHDDTVDDVLPPVDAMLRFNPPPRDPPTPPCWLELRDRFVVARHTTPEGDATTERCYGSQADALRGYAAQAAKLRQIGYTDADAVW